jgi:hypothetical protein
MKRAHGSVGEMAASSSDMRPLVPPTCSPSQVLTRVPTTGFIRLLPNRMPPPPPPPPQTTSWFDAVSMELEPGHNPITEHAWECVLCVKMAVTTAYLCTNRIACMLACARVFCAGDADAPPGEEPLVEEQSCHAFVFVMMAVTTAIIL